jgi:hypothetical protein
MLQLKTIKFQNIKEEIGQSYRYLFQKLSKDLPFCWQWDVHGSPRAQFLASSLDSPMNDTNIKN